MKRIIPFLVLWTLSMSMYALEVNNLRTQAYTNPIGIDIAIPSFSWQLSSAERGVMQTSYSIRISTERDFNNIEWESGVVESSQLADVQAKGGMSVRWPLKGDDGEICLQLTEARITAFCTNKTLAWCMQLNVQPQSKLPFQTIDGKTLTATQEDYPYRLSLERGIFQDLRQKSGLVFSILPEKGKVSMKMK